MSFFPNLFNRSEPQREPRNTTDQQLNAIFVPLRDRICDFKDATSMSWVFILPAVQKVSIRLFIQARGRDSTRKLLEFMIRKMEKSAAFDRASFAIL
jgi:hypothetical protein